MTLTCAAANDPFHCPTKPELFDSIMALLPSGRAWQTPLAAAEAFTNPENSQIGPFQLTHSGLGVEPDGTVLTVIEQYFAGVAELYAYLHLRACALIDEMYCDTANELAGEWGVEYGFPDSCEPYENLCAKVNPQGGATLEFLRSLSTRAKASLTIDDKSTDPSLDNNEIRIRVPEINEGVPSETIIPFEAGALVAGHRSPCISQEDAITICLIERVRHAHLTVTYEVIEL